MRQEGNESQKLQRAKSRTLRELFSQVQRRRISKRLKELLHREEARRKRQSAKFSLKSFLVIAISLTAFLRLLWFRMGVHDLWKILAPCARQKHVSFFQASLQHVLNFDVAIFISSLFVRAKHLQSTSVFGSWKGNAQEA